MRNWLALLMLIVLSLSGAAPACAQAPAPAAHPMGHHQDHHQSGPRHCEDGAAAHANCIGCGTELPDTPYVAPVALAPVALPMIARVKSLSAGTTPNLPLRPPRLLA